MGASLYDLVHQCDHEELRHMLSVSRGSNTGRGASRRQSSGRTSAASRKSSQRRAKTATSDAASGEELLQEDAAPDYSEARHGFIRIKCTLANRGRNVTIRNASYKVRS